MKKAIAFSFIVILAFNTLGYLFTFGVQRYRVRQQVRRSLRREKQAHTQEFIFTFKEYSLLHKYDGGREFSLNGNMYDVVKKQIRKGRIVLTAFFDHKETSLLDDFVSLIKEKKSPPGTKRIIPSFSLLNYMPSPQLLKYYIPEYSFFNLPSYCFRVKGVSLDITSPPPEAFLA